MAESPLVAVRLKTKRLRDVWAKLQSKWPHMKNSELLAWVLEDYATRYFDSRDSKDDKLNELLNRTEGLPEVIALLKGEGDEHGTEQSHEDIGGDRDADGAGNPPDADRGATPGTAAPGA